MKNTLFSWSSLPSADSPLLGSTWGKTRWKCLFLFSPISPLPFSLKLTPWLSSGEAAVVKCHVANSGGHFSALVSLSCLTQSITPSSLTPFLPLAFWTLGCFSFHLLDSYLLTLLSWLSPPDLLRLDHWYLDASLFHLHTLFWCFQFRGFKYHQTLSNFYFHSTPLCRLTNPTTLWTFPLSI